MPRPERFGSRQFQGLRPTAAAALLLTAALALTSLAGCGSKVDKPFQGQLRVWAAAPPGTLDAGGNLPQGDPAQGPLKPLYDAARAYERNHPGVRVSLQPMSWPELNAQLEQALSGSDWADQVPDVAMISAQSRPNPAWLAKGALEDVSSVLSQETTQDTWPFALDAFRDGTGLYGVPAWTTVQALYLNLSLFAERGVQPPASGRWTYDEFTRDVQRLTYSRGDGTQVAGLGVPLKAGSYELWPFLFGDGVRPLSPDGRAYTLDQGAGPTAVQRVLNWRQAGSPWVGTDQVPELFRSFATPGRQNVAITAWDSWALDELERSPALKDSPLKLGLAAYPAGPAGEATIGRAGGLVVFKESSQGRRAAALDLAAQLADASTQTALARLGTLPARVSVAKGNPFTDPLRTRLAGLLPEAELPPGGPAWTRAEPALVGELAAALEGRKPLAQALTDARKQLDPIFAAATTAP